MFRCHQASIKKKGFEVESGFSQFFFNDNFAPALFHTTASSPSPLALAFQSNKHSHVLWNSLHRGDCLGCIWLQWAPEKTTVWNYLSAPSYSVFIVLATCSAAARHPGSFGWLCWLLVLASPPATGLSAPSNSVFIVLGKGSGAAGLAGVLSAAAWASVFPFVVPHQWTLYRVCQQLKIWCNSQNQLRIKKTSVVVNFVQTSNTMSCYINEWVKAATEHCGDKTFTSNASKDTAFLRLIHGWKKLNISNIWLQKKMTVCSILGEKLHSSWLQTFCNSVKAATAKRFLLPDILGQHAAV